MVDQRVRYPKILTAGELLEIISSVPAETPICIAGPDTLASFANKFNGINWDSWSSSIGLWAYSAKVREERSPNGAFTWNTIEINALDPENWTEEIVPLAD